MIDDQKGDERAESKFGLPTGLVLISLVLHQKQLTSYEAVDDL